MAAVSDVAGELNAAYKQMMLENIQLQKAVNVAKTGKSMSGQM